MRGARRSALLAVASCLLVQACATGPDTGDAVKCCDGFGIDVRPILGADAIDCGVYSDWLPHNHQYKSRSALQCALRAQRQGRAFVYYRVESDMVDSGAEAVAVFGERGVRIYLVHVYTNDEDHTEGGVCERLTVNESGSLEGENCSPESPLFQRLLVRD